jgi:hypothetical protein
MIQPPYRSEKWGREHQPIPEQLPGRAFVIVRIGIIQTESGRPQTNRPREDRCRLLDCSSFAAKKKK